MRAPSIIKWKSLLLLLFIAAFQWSAVIIPVAWAENEVCSVAQGAPSTSPVQAYNGNVRVSGVHIPMSFVENQGQLEHSVLFYGKGREGTVYFTKNSVVYDLGPAAPLEEQSQEARGLTIRQEFLGAHQEARLTPNKRLPGKIHYLIGNDPSHWYRNVPTYESITYEGMYPGIDVHLYDSDRKLEYDFVVKPGADPNTIQLKFSGIDSLSLSPGGDLLGTTPYGELVLYQKPLIYQTIDGTRRPVTGAFMLSDRQTCSFSVAAYDTSYPLVIDPLVPAFSTYLGGSGVGGTGQDYGTGVAVDTKGSVYVSGYTNSTNFPTASAYQGTLKYVDAFVTKLSPDGDFLVYSTYLGGNGFQRAYAIAVDSSGSVYVAGSTSSIDFPTTPGSFQPAHSSPYDPACIYTPPGMTCHIQEAFVVKLAPSGDSLLYSTYLGGIYDDEAYGIAVDGSGAAYVTGYTFSHDFPTQNAFQNNHPGPNINRDAAFVAKLHPDGGSLDYSTYLGGLLTTRGRAIAVDADGSAYVAGTTTQGLPIAGGAVQTTFAGQVDGFVTRFSPSGENLIYSTFLGGSGYDECYGIAVDGTGAAYVTGYTSSSNFPRTQGAAQTAYGGGVWGDAFVVKLSPAGDSFAYSTFLGGESDDRGLGIAVDSAGSAYVTGSTLSSQFPVERASQGVFGGVRDAFATKLSPEGTSIVFSSYLGGRSQDEGAAIALGPEGTIYLTGYTNSDNFPTQAALYNTYRYTADAFITKFAFSNTLGLQFVGSPFFSPGDTVDYLIKYYNDADTAADDVVLRVFLQSSAQYVSSSNNGYYQDREHMVFWKLGSLARGQQGAVRFTVEYTWGLPAHSLWLMLADIDSRTLPTGRIPDIQSYLAYSPVGVRSEELLDQPALKAVLGQSNALKSLYTYIGSLGFSDVDAAQRTTYTDGQSILTIQLVRTDPFELAMVVQGGNTVYGVKFSDGGYSVFDQAGGLTVDHASQALISWGTWPETHSPSYQQCFVNCLVTKGIDDQMSQRVVAYKWASVYGKCWNCVNIPGSIIPGQPGYDMNKLHNCQDCAFALTKNKPQFADALKNASQCKQECDKDSGSFACKPDDTRTQCAKDYKGTYNHLDHQMMSAGRDPKVTQKCTNQGFWELWGDRTYCNKWEKCVDGKCKTCDPALLEPGEVPPPECKKKEGEAITAHDPNLKHGVQGGVIPGQTLSYSIEYENTGSGTAYGVYVTDQLDPNLDDTGLVIQDGGTYVASTRQLVWNIGTLSQGQQGQVRFSAPVSSTAPNGTDIVNVAEVHFPSVPELTPTNLIANPVRALAAHPQALETQSGVPLAITLSSAGTGGGSTYRILSDPLYGALTGTPPGITYKSMDGFSGQDSFSFAVSNGSVESDPASVKIVVLPSSSDVTPPRVIATNPSAGATRVTVNTAPVTDNQYLPTITARFSESVDGSTLTAGSFTVTGLIGVVYYDAPTQTAIFIPSAPLAPATAYIATLTSAIRDAAGNNMAADYVWQFTTKNERNVDVNLRPPNTGRIDFGATLVRSLSTPEVVTVASTGTADLTVASAAISGAQAGQFTVQSQNCSGTVLSPGQSCTARIAFSPTAAGAKQATFSIVTDDPDTPTVAVPLFGTAKAMQGDIDGDGDVDNDDLNILLSYRNKPASACPLCDLDGDGTITALDSRKLVNLCTRPRCATK